MKIGNLPEVTSPTGSYKIAVENTSGNTQRTTLLNAIKNVLGAVSCGSYATVDSIFLSYGDGAFQYVEITSANINGWGKIRELSLTVKLLEDVTIDATGTPSIGGYAVINCGRLREKYYPKTQPAYGLVLGTGYHGLCKINPSGYVSAACMDAKGTSYTIPANTTLDLQIMYLSEGAF